jgi:hypothetical protein
MANTLLMDQHFEKEKNLKASGITVVVCVCVFLLFFFVRWKTPEIPKPIPQLEGIEVNIGTSDVGSGDEQPLVKGEAGPTANQDNNPQPSAGAPPPPSENNSDEKNPDGSPAANSAKTNTKTTNTSSNTKKPENKTEAPKKAKAQMGKYPNGPDNGGNANEDNYKKNHGDDPNGTKGDKGDPKGSTTGTAWTGPIVTKGDRYPVGKFISYNTNVQPATIYADISVSESGVGTFIEISKGSSSNNEVYKKEIREYLTKHKFNPSNHVSTITMKFVFKR